MSATIKAERFCDRLEQAIAFLRSKMNDCAMILMESLHEDELTGRVRMASHAAFAAGNADRLDA